MEHPDQKLFEEVKSLKSEIIEARERIFKVEHLYKQSIEEVEKRNEREKRVNTKLTEYLIQSKEKLLIKTNNKLIPIFKESVEENMFICKYLLNAFKIGKDLVLDLDEIHIRGLLDVIRIGNLLFHLNETEKSIIDMSMYQKRFSSDTKMNQILFKYFDYEIYLKIVDKFNLPYPNIPDRPLIEMLTEFSIEGEVYQNESLEKHYAFDVVELSIQHTISDQKAFFLKNRSSLIISLQETVRCKIIQIRPFSQNPSKFAPTTGAGQTQIYTSRNGINWKLQCFVPSNYGVVDCSKNFFCNVSFPNYESFLYIKFQASATTNFSLSYLNFIG